MPNQRATTQSWSLLAGWLFASLAGWAVGLAGGMGLARVAGMAGWLNEDRVLVYAVLGVTGLATGLAQVPIVRRVLPTAGRWVGVTVAGYLLGMAVFALLQQLRAAIPEAIPYLLMGAAIGLPQWWLLRQLDRGTGLWILATALGFLSFLWLASHPTSAATEFIVVGAILGALAGLPPGLVLVFGLDRVTPG